MPLVVNHETQPPLHWRQTSTETTPSPEAYVATTLSITTVVTAPPSPTQHVSDVPQIGGSSAGFIALVVVLAAIIVGCTIAVFFLLRNHSPTPHERRAHRRDRHSLYELPVGPAGMRSKFARLFKSKRGAGWVRTADEEADEWNAADDGVFRDQDLATRERDGGRPSSFQVVRGPQNALGMSRESVEVALEAPAVALSRHVSPAPLLMMGDSPRGADPFSSSPVSIEGPRAESSTSRTDDGRFRVQSGLDGHMRSMRKLENGTKFRESLDS